MSILPELAGGRVTIDLGALVANWQYLAKLSAPADTSAVVKANAYGCGIEDVVPTLLKAGCKTFFVAQPTEGIRARSVAPDSVIYVLNGLYEGAEPHFVTHNLRPVISTFADAERWASAARSQGTALPCALHMDSGMERLGFTERELARLVSQDHIFNHLDVTLFMTHYACADDVGHPKTELQRERFVQAAEQYLPGVPKSAANSAAILQADGHQFDLTRPGIAMYGGEALNDTPNPMKPVVTLEGRITQIRKSKAGESVGYGATQVLIRDTRIAYVSLGYADGYHRAASNTGVPMRGMSTAAKAAFNGKIIAGLGRISMDLAAFDVTDIPENEIAQGDWIELFGPNIAVDDVARAAGTIGYEMLTGIGGRYSRQLKPLA